MQLYTAYSLGIAPYLKKQQLRIPSSYGIDSDDDIEGNDDDSETVSVQEINIPFSSESLETLQNTINPLQRCSDFGQL